MNLTVSLQNIQHIKALQFSVDLDRFGLTAIVGKNGSGKTTLAKAIRTISFAETFSNTAADGICGPESSITYLIDDDKVVFSFDPSIKGLNCRNSIPTTWRTAIFVELSIPFGERFNSLKSVSNCDLDIRRALILENYLRPDELISILQNIYTEPKFEELVEVRVKGVAYYCIRLPGNRYLREDYFSSGEYFLVSLYKRIVGGCRLIFIDEIDISLDASAQVRLVSLLRELCARYKVNIVFTTHSLALMHTLGQEELHYMERTNECVEIKPASYNYIKGLLFGFKGWDRYILTEDAVLKEFVEFAIARYCSKVFYTYIIIYVGGGANVTDMLKRNSTEEFFSASKNVVAVLDGDQRLLRHARKTKAVYCVPLESVEKNLFTLYNQNPSVIPRLVDESRVKDKDPKSLFEQIVNQRLLSKVQIYALLCENCEQKMQEFAATIEDFLNSANEA